MKKALLATSAFLTSTSSAFALAVPTDATTAVPEISALEGMAAVAALSAVVLLVWERRRRAM